MSNSVDIWSENKQLLKLIAKNFRMFSNLKMTTVKMSELTPIEKEISDSYRNLLIDMIKRGFTGHLDYEDTLPLILMPIEFFDLHLPKIKRYVNIDEIPDESNQWLASLSNHPIIEDTDGVYRFERRDYSHFHDMNSMTVEYKNGRLSRDEYMQFYRDIGYSLDGYWDIWGDELNIIQREQILSKPIKEIEKEIWDNGDVSEQLLNMAEALTKYNPEHDQLPDLGEVVKLLRFAEMLYQAYIEEY